MTEKLKQKLPGKMGRAAAVQTRRRLAKWGPEDQHRGIWDNLSPPGTTHCESKSAPVDQC